MYIYIYISGTNQLEDDRLPKMICHECEEKVAATFEFREQCRKSENFLRLHYESCISDKLDLVKISDYKIVVVSLIINLFSINISYFQN